MKYSLKYNWVFFFNKRENKISATEMNADHEIDIISDEELLTYATSHN